MLLYQFAIVNDILGGSDLKEPKVVYFPAPAFGGDLGSYNTTPYIVTESTPSLGIGNWGKGKVLPKGIEFLESSTFLLLRTGSDLLWLGYITPFCWEWSLGTYMLSYDTETETVLNMIWCLHLCDNNHWCEIMFETHPYHPRPSPSFNYSFNYNTVHVFDLGKKRATKNKTRAQTGY